MTRILVAGEIYIDQVLAGFTAWPQPGEEADATSFTREVGGGAPHTAAGLARLGWTANELALRGPVGANDVWLHGRLGKLGLDTAGLYAHPSEPTGTTIAVSMPQDRTFFTYRGANQAVMDVLHELPHCEHLHAAAPVPPELIAHLASKCRTLSIDAGWHPGWLADPAVHLALASVSWFFPNEIEAAAMTGETDPGKMIESFRELGIRAAVKLGPHGSCTGTPDGLLHVPAPPIEPLDTTGAGDCFDAGFLDGWLRGEPLERCLAQGNICGALSTRATGGMNGFPTKEELNQWLQPLLKSR